MQLCFFQIISSKPAPWSGSSSSSPSPPSDPTPYQMPTIDLRLWLATIRSLHKKLFQNRNSWTFECQTMKPLIYLMGHVKTSLSVLVAIDFMVASPSSSTPSTSIISSVQSNGSIWFQISETSFFWSLAKLNLTAGSSGGALYILWNSRNHSPVGTIGNDDLSVELLSQFNFCSDAIDVSTGWTTIWS